MIEVEYIVLLFVKWLRLILKKRSMRNKIEFYFDFLANFQKIKASS